MSNTSRPGGSWLMPCLSAPSKRRRWVEKFASSWIGRSPPRVKLSTDMDGRRDARLCHLEPPGSLGGLLFLIRGTRRPSVSFPKWRLGVVAEPALERASAFRSACIPLRTEGRHRLVEGGRYSTAFDRSSFP